MNRLLFWLKIPIERAAFWPDYFVVVPWKTARPAEFLELVQRKSREEEQQDDLHRLEIAKESDRDRDGSKRESQVVPMPAKEIHSAHL